MITKKQYNELRLKIENLERLLNGGKGSGNFGHSGRPGEVGGSAPSGSSGSVSSGNLRARLKGTDLENFTDDELLKFYKARLADEKDAKERVMSMGGSKETIDSFDKNIKAYEKDIAALETEKQKQGKQDIDKKIERAKDYSKTSSDRSASWVEEADREAARDLGLEPDTMAPTKGEFWQEAIAILEARKDQQATQSKEQKPAGTQKKKRK